MLILAKAQRSNFEPVRYQFRILDNSFILAIVLLIISAFYQQDETQWMLRAFRTCGRGTGISLVLVRAQRCLLRLYCPTVKGAIMTSVHFAVITTAHKAQWSFCLLIVIAFIVVKQCTRWHWSFKATGPKYFVFCRLYPSSPDTAAVSGSSLWPVISLLLIVSVSRVRAWACLSRWLEKFHGSQK